MLTLHEKTILRVFAAIHGCSWKRELRRQWMNGTASQELTALRNRSDFGPRGLDEFRLTNSITR